MAPGSKGLAYKSNEPAFLRRIKSQLGGQTVSAPQPKRPVLRKGADGADEDDDAPAYVDVETSETLSQDQIDSFLKEKSGHSSAATASSSRPEEAADSKTPATSTQSPSTSASSQSRSTGAIGTASKKRTAKAINTQHEEPSSATQPAKSPSTAASQSQTRPKKATKRVKASKLSFADDEAE